MSEELKPCPFCGSDAEAFHHYGTAYMDESWHIECVAKSCGCGTCHHETQTEAITAWNTRAPDAEDSEMLTIAWMDGSHRSTKAHRQTIRNLREAGDRLAMFSTHDEDCAINWTHPGCDCGYTTAINAWKELGE